MKEERLGILLTSYMCHCQLEKALNTHTLKAYRRDINQFIRFSSSQADPFSKENIQDYIAWLHTDYAARSVKRKMASLKAFFTYLTFEGELADDPFSHMRIRLREPSLLPRTIPLATIDQLLRHIYSLQSIYNKRTYAYRAVVRDVAVLELLFATGIRILWLHLPKGNLSIFPTVGIRDVKYIADAVGRVGVAQQSNAGGSPVYPASQTVPDIDFRTGCGIRTLGIDKHLFPEGVLVVPGSIPQEGGVVSGAGYDFPRFAGKQLRKDFIFSGHSFSLTQGNGNFHRAPVLLDGGVQKPRPGIGYFRHHLIQPAYGSIDLLLGVGVVVPPLVAANGAAVLPQAVDLPAQTSSVNGKEPLQLTAVNGPFSTGMVLFEILADRCFLIHCFTSLLFQQITSGLCFLATDVGKRHPCGFPMNRAGEQLVHCRVFRFSGGICFHGDMTLADSLDGNFILHRASLAL